MLSKSTYNKFSDEMESKINTVVELANEVKKATKNHTKHI